MKILHVEDSNEVRGLYSDMLTAHNHAITSINNGKEGLEFAIKNDYDLILLDMCMPEYSGLQFIHDLKNQRPSELAKVVIVSILKYNENQIRELLKLGILCVEEKPYTLEKFKELREKMILKKNSLEFANSYSN